MVGNLYACAVGHDTLFVLVDDDPTLRRTYDVGEANSTRKPPDVGPGKPRRGRPFFRAPRRERVEGYERMLADVTSFPVARRNHNKRGKLNVLSGKRLDEGRSLADSPRSSWWTRPSSRTRLPCSATRGRSSSMVRLAPEDVRRAQAHGVPSPGRGTPEIVQFHPSYSYEDFVHGYRPVTRADGALAYELKPGPLMRLARQAGEVPGEHVLLVDEINRGNLPKILGELLYLLEYREDKVVLMYGEGEARFSLPEDLLIVGTMNTADRSIALIDAAMRRRFHFVPFFPNEWPLEGLLRRWLQRHRPG
jgi:hypothetical protein